MRSLPPLERLVRALSRLPGIGEKSATRLAFFLLSSSEELSLEISEAIRRLKQEIVLCEHCFDLTESSPCSLCSSDKREANLLCVVEEPADLAAIERSGSFRGRYHVLGGALSPIDGIGPGELHMAELEKRIRGGGFQEVILATNPNAEGDATAHYIVDRLQDAGVRFSRIAYGMPLGGDLEYADQVTVGRSLENRQVLD